MRIETPGGGAFGAEILDASASAYAGFAASLLLERHPEVEARFAPSAMAHWKAFYAERLRELSTSMALDEAEVFIARVRWHRQAFRARDVPEEDLRASLECLREVLKEELPDVAADETAAILDRALEIFDEPGRKFESGLDPERPMDKIALRYLVSALEGQSRQAIDQVLAAVDEGLTLEEAYQQILLPAQREVGRLWHAGELSIAEEHLVTATTRQAMSFLVRRVPAAASNGRTVITAAVAGNVHDIAVRAIADFFELDGWRVVCLGADVPASELAEAVRDFEADLLILSVALSVQLRMAERTIAAVRDSPEGNVKILVGGQAFDASPTIWERVGADGYSESVVGAVATGNRLLTN